MDMSYPFFSYTSVSFSDNISQVEPIRNSNSLLLIRFQNDKYSAILLDGHTNTQVQINGNINGLMYFQNYIMFLQKPYNQLLVLKASNPINQNIFFTYDNLHVYSSEAQQLLGSPNGDVIEIQYYKDGSKKIFQNKAKNLQTYFTNYIEDTYIYASVDIDLYGYIVITDIQSGKVIQISQPNYYKVLRADDIIKGVLYFFSLERKLRLLFYFYFFREVYNIQYERFLSNVIQINSFPVDSQYKNIYADKQFLFRVILCLQGMTHQIRFKFLNKLKLLSYSNYLAPLCKINIIQQLYDNY
ncbi:hypothetical protein TTHERM_000986278 (macronuclear) [Tetrahymena thermophila SB210]|uniref:Uncharacterized protein n=1 Tax=Tetrahymena thermophila (strain SB210) TaxID=312017 RepID=W7XJD7_TETTS|nr:hypothetical protein TTHERM_000986278 [Tetrahymena thermophila SB210]EWS75441.1 hypothetical protein TTHERM_000986278 [Tetrahymena thermophila SB210]|eukprot:XP_012652026.1 hypothetical protein TTHERM_000986278 [Tetrahymena thermophila SB210]